MSDAFGWNIFWFMLGIFVATVVFDILWRIARRAANELIDTQREYIAELEQRRP
jgi:divalent metal cation (Fe/Co/Zn/Cd) transporter